MYSAFSLSLSLDTSKCSIFSFKKVFENKTNFTEVQLTSTPNTSILDLLGVQNNSVLMANCSIWVEGVSDRKIIQAFLRAYTKDNNKTEYLEDYHYAFFEYAGSNLSHYLFEADENDEEAENKIAAHFLSNRIFLIADQDTDKDKKHKKYKKQADGQDNFEYLHHRSKRD